MEEYEKAKSVLDEFEITMDGLVADDILTETEIEIFKEVAELAWMYTESMK